MMAKTWPKFHGAGFYGPLARPKLHILYLSILGPLTGSAGLLVSTLPYASIEAIVLVCTVVTTRGREVV